MRPTHLGHCRLCEDAKPLQKSHIIPNAYFKKLKRSEGFAIQGEITEGVPTKRTQESWAKRLLCRDCEQLIAEWERYAVAFTSNPKSIGVSITKTERVWRYSNVDYRRLRLFQISVLFRAAVAEGREFYYIVLNEMGLLKLRQAMLGGDLPKPSRFGCQMKLLWNPTRKSPLLGFVGVPVGRTVGRTEIISISFGSFAWEFYVPKLRYKELRGGFYLKEDGTLRAEVVDCLKYKPFREIVEAMVSKEQAGLSKL